MQSDASANLAVSSTALSLIPVTSAPSGGIVCKLLVSF